MYKKTYLSFRFITYRPLCQIKQGDQTGTNVNEKNEVKSVGCEKILHEQTTH